MAEFKFTQEELKEIAKGIKSLLSDQEERQDLAPKEAVDRAIKFCSDTLRNHYTYHNHKETMAYAGAGLQIALFGYIMIAEQWPPCWLNLGINFKSALFPMFFTIVIVFILWLFIHIYTRWQLCNRRMATLEYAGTVRALASWIINPPEPDDLKPRMEERKDNSISPTWKDYLYPRPLLRFSSEVEDAYPYAIYKNIVEQWNTTNKVKKIGTRALIHEWIHFGMSVVLFLGIIARTFARSLGVWTVIFIVLMFIVSFIIYYSIVKNLL